MSEKIDLYSQAMESAPDELPFRTRAGVFLSALAIGLVAPHVAKASIDYEHPSYQSSPAAEILVTDAAELEQQYPTSRVIPYDEMAPRIIDYEQTTDSYVVYHHEGLEGMTFTAMAQETARNIQMATSVEEAERLARPVFAASGLNLHITDLPHDPAKGYEVASEQELDYVKHEILSLAEGVAMTPRELIKFANVDTIYLAREAKRDGQLQDWGGFAEASNGKPGTMTIFVNPYDGRYHSFDIVADLWHHEFAHHLTNALDKRFNGSFAKNYAAMNPDWFMYKDDIDTERESIEAAQQRTLKRGVDKLVTDEYGETNENEDEADTYTAMMTVRGAPDPSNATTGSPNSQKRVVLLKYLDAVLPGFEKYVIGTTTYQTLSPLHVPENQVRDDFSVQYALGSGYIPAPETLPGTMMSPRDYQIYLRYGR